MIVLLPNPDLRALATGETIVAFVARGAVSSGADIGLAAAGPRPPDELRPAYQRWADVEVPAGDWTASVDDVLPAADLDPIDAASQHILARLGRGDVIVLRVHRDGAPVLTDDVYAARRTSLDSTRRR